MEKHARWRLVQNHSTTYEYFHLPALRHVHSGSHHLTMSWTWRHLHRAPGQWVASQLLTLWAAADKWDILQLLLHEVALADKGSWPRSAPSAVAVVGSRCNINRSSHPLKYACAKKLLLTGVRYGYSLWLSQWMIRVFLKQLIVTKLVMKLPVTAEFLHSSLLLQKSLSQW